MIINKTLIFKQSNINIKIEMILILKDEKQELKVNRITRIECQIFYLKLFEI